MPKHIGELKRNTFKTPGINSQFGRWESYTNYNSSGKVSKAKNFVQIKNSLHH